MSILTANCIRSLLDYEPSTGDFTWRVSRGHVAKGARAGAVGAAGYVYIGINGKTLRAHRLAWLHVHGRWPMEFLDHINGARSDNRIENLREVSNAENMQNIRVIRAKSGLVGVYWHKRGRKWMASIQVNKKQIYLGLHESEDGARDAYLKAKKELHPFSTEISP